MLSEMILIVPSNQARNIYLKSSGPKKVRVVVVVVVVVVVEQFVRATVYNTRLNKFNLGWDPHSTTQNHETTSFFLLDFWLYEFPSGWDPALLMSCQQIFFKRKRIFLLTTFVTITPTPQVFEQSLFLFIYSATATLTTPMTAARSSAKT